jgi:hypothetical protein
MLRPLFLLVSPLDGHWDRRLPALGAHDVEGKWSSLSGPQPVEVGMRAMDVHQVSKWRAVGENVETPENVAIGLTPKVRPG